MPNCTTASWKPSALEASTEEVSGAGMRVQSPWLPSIYFSAEAQKVFLWHRACPEHTGHPAVALGHIVDLRERLLHHLKCSHVQQATSATAAQCWEAQTAASSLSAFQELKLKWLNVGLISKKRMVPKSFSSTQPVPSRIISSPLASWKIWKRYIRIHPGETCLG